MNNADKEAGVDKSGVKKWNPFERLFGMKREAPEFRRCCFCLPLRRGLIGWGYIKLALNMLAFGLMVFLTVYLGTEAVQIMEMVFLLSDTALNVLFIVGGHQKNIKILKITYIYSLVWLGLALVSFCWMAYIDISLAVRFISLHLHYPFILAVLLPGFCVQFAIFFVQIYWILLIRSLVAKLQDQTVDFQFTNPSATEAQCTLHKHNPLAAEPNSVLHNASTAENQGTLDKHNPSAAEVQCTLHKHDPSAAEAQCALHKHNSPVTDELNEKPNASLESTSSKYVTYV